MAPDGQSYLAPDGHGQMKLFVRKERGLRKASEGLWTLRETPEASGEWRGGRPS